MRVKDRLAAELCMTALGCVARRPSRSENFLALPMGSDIPGQDAVQFRDELLSAHVGLDDLAQADP